MSGEQTSAWLDEIERNAERVNAGLYYVGAEDFDALVAAVRAALDLHSPVDRGTGPQCQGCATHVTFTRWPCKTHAAIAAALSAPGGAGTAEKARRS